MDALQIRPARVADVENIVALVETMHQAHLSWDADRWTTRPTPPEVYADWVRELVAPPATQGLVLVASWDGALVGYLLAETDAGSPRHWSPPSVYLHDLFVRTSHRQRGIAGRLLQAFCDWTNATHPGLQVRLMTAAQNESARGVFARYGFRPCVVEMVRPAPGE